MVASTDGDLPAQPGASLRPFAAHRDRRHFEHVRDLLQCEAAEESQLDDLRLARIAVGKLSKGVVQGHQLVGAVRRRVLRFRDRTDSDVPAVGPFRTPAGDIDQDVSHQSGRHGHEMGAVLPTDVTPVHQADECFVHERAGLKHMARALTPEIPARKLAKLRLNQRYELVEGGVVPSSPGQEKPGDLRLLAAGARRRMTRFAAALRLWEVAIGFGARPVYSSDEAEPRVPNHGSDISKEKSDDSDNGLRTRSSRHRRGRLACLYVGLDAPAEAEITRIVITRTQSPTFDGLSFGEVGQYEKLAGRAFGEVDPTDPRNAVIADIQLAPRNARGMVEYSMDIFILKPVALANGNHRLLYYMNNRGNLDSPFFPSIGVLSVFNDGSGGNDPTTAAHAGNGFLMRQGYTIVSSGWDAGVAPGANRLTLSVPVAKNPDGSPIVGPSLEEIVIDNATTITAGLTYPAATLDKSQASLTVRVHYDDPPVNIPATGWEYVNDRTIRLLACRNSVHAGQALRVHLSRRGIRSSPVSDCRDT